MRYLTYTFLFIGVLCAFDIFAQTHIDSIEFSLKNSKVDTVRIDAYKKIINYYLTNDTDKAIAYCDSLKSYSDEISNIKGQLNYFVLRGIAFYRNSNYEKAIQIFKKGIDHKGIDDYLPIKIRLMHNVGVGYKVLNKKDSVKKYLSKSLTLSEEINHTNSLLGGYYSISDFYFSEGDYSIASEYLQKLFDLSQKEKNLEYEARVYILLAKIDRIEYDFDSAILNFRKAIEKYEESISHNKVLIYALKYELAKTLLLNDEHKNAINHIDSFINTVDINSRLFYDIYLLNKAVLLSSYLSLEEKTNAQKTYLELINAKKDLSTFEPDVLLPLAKYEITYGLNKTNTVNNLNEMLLTTLKNKKHDLSSQIHHLLSKHYKQLNDLSKSIDHLELSIKYRDSFNTNKNKVANLSFDRKFETQKKETENQQLKAENTVQALLTEKANTQKWLFAMAFIMVSISAFFIWRRYRSEAKANRTIGKQKEVIEELQKELHHRIKNNLSIIDTFIEVAKDEFKDKRFEEKLTELQNRIQSINEIHKQLYTNVDVTHLNIKKYIHSLATQIATSLNSEIPIKQSIDESLHLNANQSFPVGLIINEFVTNSIKYAFPKKTGNITIEMAKYSQNYTLTLSDNGIGLPKDFDINTTESFGMRIMKVLAKQLEGSFELQNNKGVELSITFPNNSL